VRLSHAMGFCDLALVDEVIALLRGVGLPTSLTEAADALAGCSFDVDRVWGYMMSDKKKRAGRLRFVLLRAPGDAFVYDEVPEMLAKNILGRIVH
jgi:3-dehydroquinate synthetase